MNAENLTLNATVGAESTDNATRVAEINSPISELQTFEQLAIKGQRLGSYSLFEADARVESRQFSVQEDLDRTLYLGSTSLFLGTKNSRFAVDVNYFAEEILIDPFRGATDANLDRRNIASAAGSLRLGNQVNRLTVRVNRSDIDFDQSNQNDAQQTGAGLLYRRSLGATRYLGVDLSGYKMSFDDIDTTFDYRRAALNFGAARRLFSYDASLGVNDAGSDTSKHPFYTLDMAYGDTLSKVSLEASQVLTDTSQGAGADGVVGGAILANGQTGTIDQYVRRAFFVRWQYAGLCGLCDLTTYIGHQQELYEKTSQLDSVDQSAGVTFQFQPNRWLVVVLDAERHNFEFEQQQREYSESIYRLSLGSGKLMKRGELKFYAQAAPRDVPTDRAQEYSVNSYGLTFNYLLYER
ncbi:MAG: hypothetical protein U5M23_05505 [Marinagarivorans sp.]|nr:hypothetical protein [Marinagarivorans sp.]